MNWEIGDKELRTQHGGYEAFIQQQQDGYRIIVQTIAPPAGLPTRLEDEIREDITYSLRFAEDFLRFYTSKNPDRWMNPVWKENIMKDIYAYEI